MIKFSRSLEGTSTCSSVLRKSSLQMFFFLPDRFTTVTRLPSDDNEGSSSDTAPLFQMAGDGRSTDDITLPLLFLFHKEGNILLEALKEYREVEVLLSDKARDRGATLLTNSSTCSLCSARVLMAPHSLIMCNKDESGGSSFVCSPRDHDSSQSQTTAAVVIMVDCGGLSLINTASSLFPSFFLICHIPLFLVVDCNSSFPLLCFLVFLLFLFITLSSSDEQPPYSKVNLCLAA